MTNRPSTAAPILAATLLVVALLLGAYVGGYFWLGQETAAYKLEKTWVRRSFPSKGYAMAYQPLAKLESWLAGWDVRAVDVNLYGE